MIWLFIYKRYWSVDFVKGRVYYYYSICLSIFYLISSEFACFEDDMWNAWLTSILLPYSSIFTIVLFYIWVLGFELRNTGISHSDLYEHEYLQAGITFRYYLIFLDNSICIVKVPNSLESIEIFPLFCFSLIRWVMMIKSLPKEYLSWV